MMRDVRGFTLLEVLVALAILGVTIVVSIQGFAQGLRLLKLAGDHQEAALLGDQKLREMIEPEVGEEQGTEGVYTWSRTTKELEAPDLDVVGRPLKWKVYEITVSVTWGAGGGVQLATLRTRPDLPPETRTTP